MKRCAICKGNELRAEKGAETRELHLGSGRVLEFKFDDAPRTICLKCGERYYDGAVLRAMDDAIARELVKQGARDPAIFKWIRKYAGIKATELAELLGVTPETISHWENGHSEPDLAEWATLGMLVEDFFNGSTRTADRLRSWAAAREPKAKTHLRLAAGG